MIFAIPTDTCFGFATSLYNEAGFRLIYDLKGRDASKRLSIVVSDFSELCNVININAEQIAFLKEYPYPFTVIGIKSDSFILPSFLNKDDYFKVAVRVGERCLRQDIMKNLEFPMFLTSANLSGQDELYSDSEIRARFGQIHDMKIIEGTISVCPPSDIFSFVGDTLELDYLRRNH